MNIRLMCCPFCGSDATYVNEMESHDRFWVECKICETDYPKDASTREDAVRNWNDAFCWKAAKKSQCIYCGYVGPKDLKDMVNHASMCEKRPEKKVAKALFEFTYDVAQQMKRILSVVEFDESHAHIRREVEQLIAKVERMVGKTR